MQKYDRFHLYHVFSGKLLRFEVITFFSIRTKFLRADCWHDFAAPAFLGLFFVVRLDSFGPNLLLFETWLSSDSELDMCSSEQSLWESDVSIKTFGLFFERLWIRCWLHPGCSWAVLDLSAVCSLPLHISPFALSQSQLACYSQIVFWCQGVDLAAMVRKALSCRYSDI